MLILGSFWLMLGYLVSLALGVGYAVIAGVVCAAGASPGVGTEAGISPFSPPVVAMTLVTFSAIGIVFTSRLNWGTLSLAPSLLAGIAAGLVTFLYLHSLVQRLRR